MTTTEPTIPPTPPPAVWRGLLLDQLSFYWDFHLWPRLEGLTDAEYLWEPASPAWSVRHGPDGEPRLEQEVPEPEIPPVTTIAWRMVHVGRDVFDPRHWPEAPITADGGLAMLEEGYRSWQAGIATLDDESLMRPIGPKGVDYALLRDLYRAQYAPSASAAAG